MNYFFSLQGNNAQRSQEVTLRLNSSQSTESIARPDDFLLTTFPPNLKPPLYDSEITRSGLYRLLIFFKTRQFM
jgi:hypothetical protein